MCRATPGTRVAAPQETPNVASLQAAVTFPTEAGVTSYVQAGGFAGEAGTLQLSVH
jgi:hypothetical protein